MLCSSLCHSFFSVVYILSQKRLVYSSFLFSTLHFSTLSSSSFGFHFTQRMSATLQYAIIKLPLQTAYDTVICVCPNYSLRPMTVIIIIIRFLQDRCCNYRTKWEPGSFVGSPLMHMSHETGEFRPKHDKYFRWTAGHFRVVYILTADWYRKDYGYL